VKRTALASLTINLLLVLTMAGTQLARLGNANPNPMPISGGEIADVPGAKPPVISIFSPSNNTVYNQANLSLTYNVSVGEVNSKTTFHTWIYRISYRGDWQETETLVDLKALNYVLPTQFSINLTGIPDGKHNLTINASETGYYYVFSYPPSEYTFHINASSTFSFSVDTIPPVVSALSTQNQNKTTTDIPFVVVVNEPVSQVTYVLDAEENVTVTGNITLTELSNREHNITVYALDTAGNIGSSETMLFTVAVPESFPTVPVAVASGASFAAVAAGALVYVRKRGRGQSK
jgi:hypothetical protein